MIPNGAAFDAAEDLERRPADRCTLLYAGYFFGSRSPEPLLAGRGGAAGAGGRSCAACCGCASWAACARATSRRSTRTGSATSWTTSANRPYREALQAQRDADVLVLLTQAEDGQDGAVFVPGKTWEYLTMARPILAVVPEQGHAAATLRELEAPATIVDPADTEGVAAGAGVAGRALAGGRPAGHAAAGGVARPHLAPRARRGAGRARAPRGRAASGGDVRDGGARGGGMTGSGGFAAPGRGRR